jgi:hypothetical protein
MIGPWRAHWQGLVAEQGGAGAALLYVVHRMLQRLSGGRVAIVPYWLMAQPIGAGAFGRLAGDPHTVVRPVSADDPVTAAFPRPREVVAQRFASGAECHVVWVRGQFAGHIWIARGRFAEDEVRCVFEIADPATGVWDFDVYLEPRLRFGRTMGRLWMAVDEALAATGVRWSFSRINGFNSASLRAHERLGARAVGRAVFLCVGRRQLAWVRGGTGRGAGWRFELAPKVTLRPPGEPAAPT